MEIRREELEARRVAVADERIVNLLLSELSVSKEALKLVKTGISQLDGGDSKLLKDALNGLEEFKKSFSTLRQELLTYISKVSPTLYNREDWLRISSKIYGIFDKINGIIYRVEYFADKGWTITPTIREGFVEQVDTVSEILGVFQTALSALLSNSKVALKKLGDVKELESKADSLYRSMTFTILESNVSTASMILLLKIAEMLEDIADTVDSAADDLYIILLGTF